jgi:ribose 5-phosphate isomerase B
MKISIGNDHAGPDYKKSNSKMLDAKGYEVTMEQILKRA